MGNLIALEVQRLVRHKREGRLYLPTRLLRSSQDTSTAHTQAPQLSAAVCLKVQTALNHVFCLLVTV